MAFVEWDSTYSVNFAQIDRQHRRLFGMINQLHKAMTWQPTQGPATSGASAPEPLASVVHELATMAEVLDDLLDYMCYHFSVEEKLMLARSYPEYAVHKAAHTQFDERVQAFKRGFDAGEALRSTEIVQFLKDWLTRHIQVVDKKLGRFLNQEGLT